MEKNFSDSKTAHKHFLVTSEHAVSRTSAALEAWPPTALSKIVEITPFLTSLHRLQGPMLAAGTM